MTATTTSPDRTVLAAQMELALFADSLAYNLHGDPVCHLTCPHCHSNSLRVDSYYTGGRGYHQAQRCTGCGLDLGDLLGMGGRLEERLQELRAAVAAARHEPCRMCGGPNDYGELCATCAEQHHPFDADLEGPGGWLVQAGRSS